LPPVRTGADSFVALPIQIVVAIKIESAVDRQLLAGVKITPVEVTNALANTAIRYGPILTHSGLISIEHVRVRFADRRRRDLDDHITRVLNLRIGNIVHAHITFSVPTECLHLILLNSKVV
jgi:hypothetical protein